MQESEALQKLRAKPTDYSPTRAILGAYTAFEQFRRVMHWSEARGAKHLLSKFSPLSPSPMQLHICRRTGFAQPVM